MTQKTESYNDNFYREHLGWQEYYALISDWIRKNTKGAIYGDIGCGNGFIIRNLKKSGKEVWGVDGSEAFLKYVDKSIKKDVQRVDLSNEQNLRKCDVAMCMEVAEHIDKKYADTLVNNIISTDAKTIIFTAATPGQGGTDHINLQPHTYWIEKFTTHGYVLDKKLSKKFVTDLNEKLTGCRWYLDNMMIFRKRKNHAERQFLNNAVSGLFNKLRDKRLSIKKENAELSFWQNEIQQYVRWYKGEIKNLYGLKAPDFKFKDKGTVEKNAIFTFIEADKDRYLKHLTVGKEFFKNMNVLEVGCGPLPNSLAFNGCKIIGIDPLIESYKASGYPMGDYSDRIEYVQATAEKIPFQDQFFDAVISVNAIDHVDNFQKAAGEITRVLKKNGTLLIETHYHKSKECEPIELDDMIVKGSFKGLKLKKLSDRPFRDFYPNYGDKDERLVVWLGKK